MPRSSLRYPERNAFEVLDNVTFDRNRDREGGIVSQHDLAFLQSFDTRTRLAHYLRSVHGAPDARWVGGGEFGQAFALGTDAGHFIRRALRSGRAFIGRPGATRADCARRIQANLRRGRRVLAKFQLLLSRDNVEDAQHEDLVHSTLSQAESPARKYLPQLYGGATLLVPLRDLVGDSSTFGHAAFRVTFMEFLEGYSTLHEYASLQGGRARRDRRRAVFRSVRSALLSLWSTGFFHGDLHSSNIMVSRSATARGGVRARLIDLGYAMRLRTATHKACAYAKADIGIGDGVRAAKRLHECVAMVEADAADGIATKHGPDMAYMHSDPAMLRSLRLWVDDGQPGTINGVRAIDAARFVREHGHETDARMMLMRNRLPARALLQNSATATGIQGSPESRLGSRSKRDFFYRFL
jgi:serine/threonine protein kinase